MPCKFILAPQGAGVNVLGFEMFPALLAEHLDNAVLINPTTFLLTNTKSNLKNINEIVDYTNRLAAKTNECILNKITPITIGGDHSVALGSIFGVATEVNNLGVIWIDAHADMNTDKTTPSGNIHGMILAALQGLGDERLINAFKKQIRIKTENIVIYGTRDLDKLEEQLMNEIGIYYVPFDEIRKEGITKTLERSVSYLKSKIKNLHVSFDLDVLNPLLIPGVSVPVNDGFNPDEAFIILEALFNNFFVTSFDLVEYNPKFDINNLTKGFVIKMISYLKHKFE